MSRSSRLVIAMAAMALSMLPLWPPAVDPAAAHAIVLESVPANDAVLARAPERVTLRFNSKIEKQLTRVTLAEGRGEARSVSIAGDGREPDRLEIPLPPLSPGRYVIRYKVLSADGHVTEGALRFAVGTAQ